MSANLLVIVNQSLASIYSMNGSGTAALLAAITVADTTPEGLATLVAGLQPFLATQPTGKAAKRSAPSGLPMGRKAHRGPLTSDEVHAFIAAHPGATLGETGEALGYSPAFVRTHVATLIAAGALRKEQAHPTAPAHYWVTGEAPPAPSSAPVDVVGTRVERLRTIVAEQPGIRRTELITALGMRANPSGTQWLRLIEEAGVRVVKDGTDRRGAVRYYPAGTASE